MAPRSSRATRFVFVYAVLTVIGLVAFVGGASLRGSIDWPLAGNVLGLLIMTATAFFDPPYGRLRYILQFAALALIVTSMFFLVRRG